MTAKRFRKLALAECARIGILGKYSKNFRTWGKGCTQADREKALSILRSVPTKKGGC